MKKRRGVLERMAGLYNIMNRTRETICKNCMHFIAKRDMCTYYDTPTDAENNLKCSEYMEPGDPI